MSNAKHTPGPWHTGGSYSSIIYAADGLCRWYGVANAVVYRARHGGTETMQANAQLIAAAPELLAELEKLVTRERTEAAVSGLSDDEMPWLDDARRVIAKAKGGAA